MAHTLVTDHSATNTKLAQLTRRQAPQVAPSSPASAPLDAGNFDDNYVAAQIKGHEEVIAMFSKQAKNEQTSALRKFAMDTLSTL